jgi:hypothetical protein
MSAMVLTPARDSDFSRPGFLTARISHGLNSRPPPVGVIVAPQINFVETLDSREFERGPASVRLFFTVVQRWGHNRDKLGVSCPIGGFAGHESFRVSTFRVLRFALPRITLLHLRVWEKGERKEGAAFAAALFSWARVASLVQFPCFHAFALQHFSTSPASTFPRFGATQSRFRAFAPPRFHASAFPCFHVSAFPCIHASALPHFHAFALPHPLLPRFRV